MFLALYPVPDDEEVESDIVGQQGDEHLALEMPRPLQRHSAQKSGRNINVSVFLKCRERRGVMD